jgi:hypothetical protein
MAELSPVLPPLQNLAAFSLRVTRASACVALRILVPLARRLRCYFLELRSVRLSVPFPTNPHFPVHVRNSQSGVGRGRALVYFTNIGT